jgi:ATP-binding cassette subfamily F protein 3
MSNLLQLQNGSKSYGTKKLFDEASFAINIGEHVGVIGPNGAGKTTLFKILTDQETLDDGVLVRANSLSLGYLAQHDNWGEDETVEDYLSRGCVTPLWQLKQLAKDMGLDLDYFSKRMLSLSGGYRMRCKLLYLIGQEPNLMLLDEPTNYLDLETTLVLEKFLQGYKGAFLLISHDREFLRRTTDHILEIEQGDITKFNGNLDDYFEQKTMLRAQLEARAMSLKEKKEEVLKFVARFGAKASKASQAQSRLKTLDKMETIEIKSLPVSAVIKLPQPIRVGKVVARLEDLRLGYGDRTVLQHVNLILENGDHLAVVGLNGAGKSTFLKALAQNLEPLNGKIEYGYQVSMGYYAQHVAENLNNQKTVIEEIVAKAHPDVTRQESLGMAGSLLFSGDDIKKKIGVLSGGEKSRVALGQILLQKSPFLILDEPTNHLDFQTVEALTQALMQYTGTIAVVSHDRSFIRRIGSKILEINHGKVSVYPGTYDEYVWSLERGILSQRSDASKPSVKVLPVGGDRKKESPPTKDGIGFNYKEAKKNTERKIKQCERSLIKCNDDLKNLNADLLKLNTFIASHSESYNDSVHTAIQELGEVQIKIENVESRWLTLTEEMETLGKEIKSFD